MNSSLFENSVATEAFSFEQLLEVISVEDAENELKSILKSSNSKQLLISIGNDSQSWQAKLQYLINSGVEERNHIIDMFGFDGKGLIQYELKRRQERFTSMEMGYFENEEYGEIIDCDIEPYNILIATFGISYDEAKELIKKYGINTDKLNIQTDDEKAIYRKLQIMEELTTSKKFESYEEETVDRFCRYCSDRNYLNRIFVQYIWFLDYVRVNLIF